MVAYTTWSVFAVFYHNVVCANADEVVQLAELPLKNKRLRKRLYKEVMETGSMQYESVIGRSLFNYVVSLAALTDYYRNLMCAYNGTKFEAECNEHLTYLRSSNESVFLKDLRNYMVHKGVPSMGVMIGEGNIADEPYQVLLYTSDLVNYGGWTTRSAKYLEGNLPSVDILGLVKSQQGRLDDFYGWFFDRFDDLHVDKLSQALTSRDDIIFH